MAVALNAVVGMAGCGVVKRYEAMSKISVKRIRLTLTPFLAPFLAFEGAAKVSVFATLEERVLTPASPDDRLVPGQYAALEQLEYST